MRLLRPCLSFSLFVLMSMAAAVSARAQTTALVLHSDPDDLLGAGVDRVFTEPDSQFVSFSILGPSRVSLGVFSGSTLWHLGFSVPSGHPLAPGLYDPAYRYYGNGAMDTWSSGHFCRDSSGKFEILEIAFNDDGTLARFAADFEQHCEFADAALVGAIRFRSTISTLVPFGGAPRAVSLTLTPPIHGEVTATGIACGSAGADCSESYAAAASVALTATPDPGYVFLGWSGDCSDGGPSPATVSVNRAMRCGAWFGAVPGTNVADVPLLGQSVLFLDGAPGAAPFSGRAVFRSGIDAEISVPEASPGRVRFEMLDSRGFSSLEFQAPSGATFAPGAYEFARGSSSLSPLFPILNAYIHDNSCWHPRGRFVVHEISFDGGALQSFAADFEIRCEARSASLFGSIRVNSRHDSLIPFGGVYPTYQLHVSAERGGTITGTGFDCGADCDETYVAPTAVTLTAVPDSGFVFAGWADDCTGGATTAVTVDQRRRCTAVFSPLPGTSVPALGMNTLLVDSDVDDHAGAGTREMLIGRSSVFTVQSATPQAVWMIVIGPSDNSWFVMLSAPLGEQLTAGREYDSATVYSFQPSSTPEMAIWGLNYCNEVSGRFTIHEISFGPGGVLASLAADFEQHCESETPSLRGSIRYNASRADLIPYAGDAPTRLLFRHLLTGEMVTWVMSGSTRVATQTTSWRVGANWRAAGTGDLNGDGIIDILWQEQTTGELVAWFMDDRSRQSYAYLSIPRPADPAWKVVALADLNGDGKPDLVWQHAFSGALAAWMLDGTTVTARVSMNPDVVADPNWKVVNTGDFNGDGKTDLLWKHATEGYLVTWLMDGVTRTSVQWLSPDRLLDPAWQIATVLDINEDGKPDIIFQHPVDGRLAVWLMDGVTRTSTRMLNPSRVLDPDWRVVGRR